MWLLTNNVNKNGKNIEKIIDTSKILIFTLHVLIDIMTQTSSKIISQIMV